MSTMPIICKCGKCWTHEACPVVPPIFNHKDESVTTISLSKEVTGPKGSLFYVGIDIAICTCGKPFYAVYQQSDEGSGSSYLIFQEVPKELKLNYGLLTNTE